VKCKIEPFTLDWDDLDQNFFPELYYEGGPGHRHQTHLTYIPQELE